MDQDSADGERERAFDAFKRILDVHSAAMHAMRHLAAMPDAESVLAAQIHVRTGLRENVAFSDIESTAAKAVRSAQAELSLGFDTLRRLTFVSLCGALEYLVKATFVDQAAQDPDAAAARLVRSKVKLSATEAVGAEPHEQWRLVADRLWTELGEATPLFHPRAVKLLADFAYLPFEGDQRSYIESALSADEVKCLNEGFLVRNCLIHNGSRVSAALARSSGLKRGELVHIDSVYGTTLVRPVIKFAFAVNETKWAGAF